MRRWSRRELLKTGLTASAGLILTALPRSVSPRTDERRIVWQDLGIRSEDSAGKAWFAVARRAADGRAYIYSGNPARTNHLLRFDPDIEKWVIVKRGTVCLCVSPSEGIWGVTTGTTNYG
jgi:hypothetical protein